MINFSNLNKVVFNGVELDKVVFNGTTIYKKVVAPPPKLENLISLQDIIGDTANKVCIVRLDFSNYHATGNGQVGSGEQNFVRGEFLNYVPTIRALLQAGAKVVIMAHQGKGISNGSKTFQYLINPIASLLGTQITFISDFNRASQTISEMKRSSLAMFENIWFMDNGSLYQPDIQNDVSLGRKIGNLCSYFVVDSPSLYSYEYASTCGGAKYCAVSACNGYYTQKAIDYLIELSNNRVSRPYGVIWNGDLTDDNMKLYATYMEKVDYIFVGENCLPFWAAQGAPVSGVSPTEQSMAQELIQMANKQGRNLIFPEDLLITNNLGESNMTTQTVQIGGTIPSGYQPLDIGPESQRSIQSALRSIRTLDVLDPLTQNWRLDSGLPSNEIISGVASSTVLTAISAEASLWLSTYVTGSNTIVNIDNTQLFEFAIGTLDTLPLISAMVR